MLHNVRIASTAWLVLTCSFFGLCGQGRRLFDARVLEESPPVVAVWCDYEFVALNNEPPKEPALLQVAIWDDGRVISTVSATNAHSAGWSHQLREGWISRDTVAALKGPARANRRFQPDAPHLRTVF